jgi:hypothetical protein
MLLDITIKQDGLAILSPKADLISGILLDVISKLYYFDFKKRWVDKEGVEYWYIPYKAIRDALPIIRDLTDKQITEGIEKLVSMGYVNKKQDADGEWVYITTELFGIYRSGEWEDEDDE